MNKYKSYSITLGLAFFLGLFIVSDFAFGSFHRAERPARSISQGAEGTSLNHSLIGSANQESDGDDSDSEESNSEESYGVFVLWDEANLFLGNLLLNNTLSPDGVRTGYKEENPKWKDNLSLVLANFSSSPNSWSVRWQDLLGPADSPGYGVRDQRLSEIFHTVASRERTTEVPAFLWSVLAGDTDVMTLLLEAKSNIHERDPGTSLTAVEVAVEIRQESIVAFLLSAKANVDQVSSADRVLSVLSLAVVNGHRPVINLLLKYKADPNLSSDGIAHFPLYLASSYGDYASVELLLKAGALVDQKNFAHATALNTAVRNYSLDCVKLLLGAKAEPSNRELRSIQMEDGAFAQFARPPIMSAFAYASHGTSLNEMVVLLLKAKVNPNSQEGHWSPLYAATRLNNGVLVKNLIKMKAQLGLNPSLTSSGLGVNSATLNQDPLSIALLDQNISALIALLAMPNDQLLLREAFRHNVDGINDSERRHIPLDVMNGGVLELCLNMVRGNRVRFRPIDAGAIERKGLMKHFLELIEGANYYALLAILGDEEMFLEALREGKYGNFSKRTAGGLSVLDIAIHAQTRDFFKLGYPDDEQNIRAFLNTSISQLNLPPFGPRVVEIAELASGGWSVKKHSYFGRVFEKGVFALLSLTHYYPSLPKQYLMEVLTFVPRDWFDYDGHTLSGVSRRAVEDLSMAKRRLRQKNFELESLRRQLERAQKSSLSSSRLTRENVKRFREMKFVSKFFSENTSSSSSSSSAETIAVEAANLSLVQERQRKEMQQAIKEDAKVIKRMRKEKEPVKP